MSSCADAVAPPRVFLRPLGMILTLCSGMTGAERLHKQLGSLGRQPPAEGGSAPPLPDPRRKSMSALEYEWPSLTVSAPVSPVGELAATAAAAQTARAQQIQSTFVVRDTLGFGQQGLTLSLSAMHRPKNTLGTLSTASHVVSPNMRYHLQPTGALHISCGSSVGGGRH